MFVIGEKIDAIRMGNIKTNLDPNLTRDLGLL